MAANTRCTNVVVLDLRGKSPVTEFFVIATGSSAIQMRTVAEELMDLGKAMSFAPFRSSGMDDAKWILVDFVHVVFHVFDQVSRDFYNLEMIWDDSSRIDWRAMLGLPAVVEETREQIAARSQLEIATRDAQEAQFLVEDELLSRLPQDAEEAELTPRTLRTKRAKAVFPSPSEEPTIDLAALPTKKAAAKPKAAKKAKAKKKPAPKPKAVKKPKAKTPVKKPAAKKAAAKKLARKAATKKKPAKAAAKKAAKKPVAKKSAKR
jgi:ribosome-associated protein